tara:strand:+ start:161 stop:415 length:255 start_codon:yes stop_codon:yes gene_type:complete
VLKELEQMSLSHDPAHGGRGTSRAAHAAAEAARPRAPRALELERPSAKDQLKAGSGYGNVARALGTCCAERSTRSVALRKGPLI